MLETLIDNTMKLVACAPGGWRLQLAWWQHIDSHRHRQIRAKFIQDNCDGMADEQFYEWMGTLSVREFIHVMLLDEPEPPEPITSTDIKEVTEQVIEQRTVK